mmetsp:Transcript_52216/g.124481  ORF Transcript_52216/g.124481 Transcript_52216/m.124481 type:complete len:698 (+) Transcript_52216:87-2180(+)
MMDIPRLVPPDWQSYLSAFKEHDSSGTGMLPVASFKVLLQEVIRMPDEEVFRLLEESGAGCVKYGDFITYCAENNVIPLAHGDKQFTPPARVVRRRKELRGDLARFTTTIDGVAPVERQAGSSLERSPSKLPQNGMASSMPNKGSMPLIQAAGHESSFLPDTVDPTFILKPFEAVEARNYEEIWSKPEEAELQKFIGRYGGVAEIEIMQVDSPEQGKVTEKRKFMRISNLIHQFDNPCVLDAKLGIRTFRESEIHNHKQRPDLFKKIVEFAPEVLSEEEKQNQSITKHKWMSSRDRLSSSNTLGFRIDGITSQDSSRVRPNELKRLREVKDIVPKLLQVLPPPNRTDPDGTKQIRLNLVDQIIAQLTQLKEVLEKSAFFNQHEMIGTSLLFVVDKSRAEVHLIDFAKTQPLPEGAHVDHRSPWSDGNHEDGVLYGLENLLHMWERARTAVEDPDSELAVDSCHEEWVRNLEDLLSKHGIDTSRFGTKGARSLEEFAWELYVERSVWVELNSSGHLRRAVGIVKAWILTESANGEPLVLVDAVRGQPFARKIVMGESWEETLYRALEEFLLIGGERLPTHFKVDHDTYSYSQQERLGTEQAGYPGLWTLYHTHEVDVHIMDPNHPALAGIGLPEATEFRISVKFQTVFDTRVRHWRWAKLSEVDYKRRGVLVGSPSRPRASLVAEPSQASEGHRHSTS